MRAYAKLQSHISNIKREVDVYLAIGYGRELSTAIGFNDIDRTRIEIVILELTRNLLGHAGQGELSLHIVADNDTRGLLVEARDTGPGIPDLELAMRDGYSTAKTLGAGLPGVKRLMDEFYIESTVGHGTLVQAVKWLRLKRNSGTLRGY
jgi:anti-sigma regulatory factor (Ser/Thr protein kinase)